MTPCMTCVMSLRNAMNLDAQIMTMVISILVTIPMGILGWKCLKYNGRRTLNGHLFQRPSPLL